MIAELRHRTVHLVVLWVAFALCQSVSDAAAFSFEDIDIQSKFGERFKAELDVTLEGKGPLQVQVGDENDYRRLELDRPRIVDDLIVESLDGTGGRKTVRVISKRPLFYPSFYLVLRGTFQDGTILEHYLITVDFQQSLALKVKERKSPKRAELTPSKEVDLLRREAASFDSESVARLQNEPGLETPRAESAIRENAMQGLMPAGIKNGLGQEMEEMRTPAGITSAQAGKSGASSPRASTPAWMAKPPSTIRGNRGEDAFFPGATWVLPPLPPPAMPPMDSPQSALNHHEQASAKTRNSSYGPLARGESLLSVANKLDVGHAGGARVAAALWMDNPDVFLHGNMNGLKEGAQINLKNLEKMLEEIDSSMAAQILRSQWQEWKLLKEKSPLAENEELGEAAREIPLPSENEDQKKMIFEMLQTWKTSWERGDLDQHLSLFSDRGNGSFEGDGANTRFLKKRMFTRHKKVKLGIKQASLVLKGGQPVVSFEQSFSSGIIESNGRKDIGLVWESGAWKILKEKFKVHKYIEKSEASAGALSLSNEETESTDAELAVPYVIHASSHLDHQMATKVVNDLRELGYNAYSSPVNFSGTRKIYRVFVGRYSSLGLTQEMVAELRRHRIAQNAIPVKYPFAFLMGEYELESEAENLILDLRSRGLSPLLFTFSEKDFLNPRFKVILGAFSTEKNAARLFAELDEQKLSFKFIAP